MKLFRKKNTAEQTYTREEVYNMLDKLLSDISEELIVADNLADAWNYAFDKIYNLLQNFHKGGK